MLSRTFTLQTTPPFSVTLFFDSRSEAEKPLEVKDGVRFKRDDYKGLAQFPPEAIIIADQIIDENELQRTESNREIAKIKGHMDHELVLEKDHVLKAHREAVIRRQNPPQPRGGQVPLMMPMKPPLVS